MDAATSIARPFRGSRDLEPPHIVSTIAVVLRQTARMHALVAARDPTHPFLNGEKCMSNADTAPDRGRTSEPPSNEPGAVATATAPEEAAPADHIEVEEQLDFDRDPANTGAHLPMFWRVVVMLFTVAGIVLVLNQVFFWNLGGTNLLTNSFLYFLDRKSVVQGNSEGLRSAGS